MGGYESRFFALVARAESWLRDVRKSGTYFDIEISRSTLK